MGLFTLIFLVIALGVLAYGVYKYIPTEPYRSVANILILVTLILLLLYYAGVIKGLDL